MTADEQRIAIAKLLGVQKYYDRDEADFVYPDYVNDLNACHEFEKTLHAGFEAFYVPWLVELVTGKTFIPGSASSLNIYKATAAQRCEAFLRTVGKWKA